MIAQKAKDEQAVENGLKYFDREENKWIAFAPASKEESEKKGLKHLREILLSSLQMQNLVVLTGSGTSIGQPVNGPAMADLWDLSVTKNAKSGEVIKKIGYDSKVEGCNIEFLLSKCDAFIEVNPTVKDVRDFISDSKKSILKACSEFIKPEEAGQLLGHCTFLHRLSKRRTRDSRLKIFTTNYDLCFETASSIQGLVVLDGFSFAQPRFFDPRFFSYDIVRRPRANEDLGNYLEGVFHLYKLHGSVNWARNKNGKIQTKDNPSPDEACLIYPAKGKYQQSYNQPYLEMKAQYFSALREPNTCIVVTGFGFNDDHLAEPIIEAVRTNPHMRLIVVDYAAEKRTADTSKDNHYWKEMLKFSREGGDVWLINASFQDFATLIPDLKSLTPAQKLERDLRGIVKND